MANDLRKNYLEANIRTASPVELVLMMYDLLVSDMQQACSAIQRNDIEARTQHLRHALLIVEQLTAGLNFRDGGNSARLLGRFYSHLRAKLLEAQIRTSSVILENLIQQIHSIKRQWQAFLPTETPLISDRQIDEHAEHTIQWSV